jgi:hypothetical protein
VKIIVKEMGSAKDRDVTGCWSVVFGEGMSRITVRVDGDLLVLSGDGALSIEPVAANRIAILSR